MTEKVLKQYNDFRSLCLKNSENAIEVAEGLIGQNSNHIAYHLTVLCLEEIGKIFLGWCLLNQKEDWGKEKLSIPIDDHVKKLFWAIWGPTFGKNATSNEQMDKIRGMASSLHERRLEVLYTQMQDTAPSALKVNDSELLTYVKWARARLELAKLEGNFTSYAASQQDDMMWFAKITDDPLRRGFVFGNESQQKLIEYGNVVDWLNWLKEMFEKEKGDSLQLLEKELAKKGGKAKKQKWKIRFKLVSASHSIRANVLNSFNDKSDSIKLSRADVHTLIVDLFIGDNVTIKALWHHGWIVAKTFAGALNVGTNGFIYWNTVVDTDKYYEKIWDLENNKQLIATLATDLRLDWKSRKLFLNEAELGITSLTFGYFTNCLRNGKFEAIDEYIIGLGMLAKTDIHIRLETQCFFQFFKSFRKALIENENQKEDFDIKEVGFKQIGDVLINRNEFDKTMELGNEMLQKAQLSRPISLTDVIAMKQYSGHYFVTLALRQLHNDQELKLVLLKGNEPEKTQN